MIIWRGWGILVLLMTGLPAGLGVFAAQALLGEDMAQLGAGIGIVVGGVASFLVGQRLNAPVQGYHPRPGSRCCTRTGTRCSSSPCSTAVSCCWSSVRSWGSPACRTCCSPVGSSRTRADPWRPRPGRSGPSGRRRTAGGDTRPAHRAVREGRPRGREGRATAPRVGGVRDIPRNPPVTSGDGGGVA